MKTIYVLSVLICFGFHSQAKHFYYIYVTYPTTLTNDTVLVSPTDSVVLKAWEEDYGNGYYVDVIWRLNGVALNQIPVSTITVRDSGEISFSPGNPQPVHIQFRNFTGVENLNDEKGLRVSNNIFKDRFTFSVAEEGNVRITLYDMTGSIVLSEERIVPANVSVPVEGELLKAGVYILQVDGEHSMWRRKILHVE
jgi:hypothetical protein